MKTARASMLGAPQAARRALQVAGHPPLDAASWSAQGDLLVGGGGFVDPGDRRTLRYVLVALDWPGRKLSLMAVNFLPHAIAIRPDNPQQVVAFEKIGPGCAEFHLPSGELRRFIAPVPGRWFYGHGVFSADGALLFSTETVIQTGEGRIGVRDAHSLRPLDDFPTFGHNPHDCHLVEEGRVLVITNGGGKAGADQPCVTWVDTGTRKLLHRLEIQGERHNAGHLAITPGGTLAVVSAPRAGLGEQALGGLSLRPGEGDALQLITGPAEVTGRMSGEALSVEIHEASGTVAVTHPVGGMVTFWRAADRGLEGVLNMERPRGVTLSREGDRLFISRGLQTEVLSLDPATLDPAGAPVMDQTFLSGSHLFNWTRLADRLRH
ncbi:MAG: DUF1513 domain-containing protein [Betaproteobacteria bacterium]|jgi:hypothetical protein